jgi:hypothetical protein
MLFDTIKAMSLRLEQTKDVTNGLAIKSGQSKDTINIGGSNGSIQWEAESRSTEYTMGYESHL